MDWRKSILALFLGLFLVGCKTIQYVPVKEYVQVAVHDTTYLHRTDTLVKIPDVSVSDFIDITDTLIMRGTLSEARAWVDSTAMVLKGKLVQTGKLPVQIVERERLVYRDSIQRLEVPVPVEVEKRVPYVPFFWKLFSVIGILATAVVTVLILRKFHVL